MASPASSLVPEDPEPVPVSLDALVAHLLAAKRSLSCVEHVSHANDLVTNTRQALENNTVLTARTVFLQNGSRSQIDILEHVRKSTQSIAREAALEFEDVISNLDAAESRLRTTLDQLRATIVESTLRPEGESPRSLVDFVDETGVHDLLETIKESIDATGDARKDYERLIATLEGEINDVRRLLPSRSGNISAADTRDGFRSPVPDIHQTMTEYAQDMAHNLESLVKHFDLCVTAIKHTEGGGAAAQKIAGDLPEGVGLELSKEDGPLESLSE
jgi:autophagy-related protein 17